MVERDFEREYGKLQQLEDQTKKLQKDMKKSTDADLGSKWKLGQTQTLTTFKSSGGSWRSVARVSWLAFAFPRFSRGLGRMSAVL
ncbi:UNVERIFIED_CONTAM: hypothetical protein K2H54_034837 [Gekko kuhli]